MVGFIRSMKASREWTTTMSIEYEGHLEPPQCNSEHKLVVAREIPVSPCNIVRARNMALRSPTTFVIHVITFAKMC
jgi:hypothetical protein